VALKIFKFHEFTSGQWTSSETCAVSIGNQKSILAKAFINEVVAMDELDHPNLCKLIKYNECSEAKTISGLKVKVSYIAMEYAPRGDLLSLITESEWKRFSEPEARFFFHQLIDGLEYMHEKGYFHRDIKPENLLLDDDFNIKIADFGFVTKFKACALRKGTVEYMSPEMLDFLPYDCAQADLFAAAVTLFNLWTGKKFVYSPNIGNKFWSKYPGEELSPDFKNFFSKMVAFNPGDRLTIEQIKEDKWYKGKIISPLKMKPMKTKDTLIAFHQYENSSTSWGGSSCFLDRYLSLQTEDKKERYTRFFNVEKGENLINSIVQFAKTKGYSFRKSSKYYRVDLSYIGSVLESKIEINVSRNIKGERRCKFIHRVGLKADFYDIFSQFYDFLERKLKNASIKMVD
jgi:serine/threonine protein kinase